MWKQGVGVSQSCPVVTLTAPTGFFDTAAASLFAILRKFPDSAVLIQQPFSFYSFEMYHHVADRECMEVILFIKKLR